ncbi:MAG: hemerythrin domain-containing protein [Deltaproteobacteria bacterium]|nr:hemerythrin domain-containing protein [Deltaproteobacteria bacterium]
MKPIGPLMWEHRLIEQMASLLQKAIAQIESGDGVDVVFLERAVDFFRVYADRTHHGKEEDILFRDLRRKKLSTEHERIMQELETEHRIARNTVKALVEAAREYTAAKKGDPSTVRHCLADLVELYPKHIEKEDKHFFFPVMDYFSENEQQDMLMEFNEFDRKMIHEKYENTVEEFGGKRVLDFLRK